MANLPDFWRDFDRPFGGLQAFRPLLRQLDDFLGDSPGFRSDEGWSRSFVPSCDIDETDEHYLLSFDMPGMDKDQIEIELQGNQLMVSGERKQEQKSGEGRSRFVERRYGRFQRSITLPAGVKSDALEAHYMDGVLRIVVPKGEESKRQRIKVGAGESGLFSKLAHKISDSISSESGVGAKNTNVNVQSKEGKGTTAH